MGAFVLKLAMHLKLFAVLLLATSAFASKAFSRYQYDFGKTYSSEEELATRRAIFEANVKKINEHNAKFAKGKETYEMGINQFTDMTQNEFEAHIQGLPKSLPKGELNSKFSEDAMKDLRAKYANYKFKDSFSWVDQGVVTSIKNQRQCGSCTAFACTGAVESCFAIKSGNVYDDLSEQFLVDCANGYSVGGFGAYGCEGAWPQAYFAYLHKEVNGYHQKESSYPYEAVDRSCRATSDGYYMGGTVTNAIDYWGTDENDLKALLVEYGPVVTTIDASQLGGYRGGVLDSNQCCNAASSSGCTNKNNHAVLVVGYGSNYWLVKNSWGSGFGESGYFKIKKGSGHCGFGWQVNSVPLC